VPELSLCGLCGLLSEVRMPPLRRLWRVIVVLAQVSVSALRRTAATTPGWGLVLHWPGVQCIVLVRPVRAG
jgi:hypothetical protein